MGDVVHALPAVSDMLRHDPTLEIDWLVEAPFAAIPALHPGVRRVIPLAWRKWRKRLGSRATWQAIGALRDELRCEPYDLVLDLQGNLKSALWATQARGLRAGYDRQSVISEPLASLFYGRTARVPRDMQAVERNRRLAGAHLGYAQPDRASDTPPVFGIRPPATAGWAAPAPYALLIPNASRPEKFWPEDRWIAVGQRLRAAGWTPLVLWGSEAERQMAERIAAGCGGALPPFLKVGEMAAVLAGARAIVGLDTGFSHLGAAFGVPTLGIYCDHEPGHAGIAGPDPGRVASIGGIGQVPALAAVLGLLEPMVGAVAQRVMETPPLS